MALFVLPRGSAYGQNVVAFNGAKLYFYEAGTATAKTTYSDPGLTVPNADPVVADANGVFDAIFLSGTYKVVLKDSADVTIWTEDDLNARDGDLTYQGGFDSTTNAGDYPSSGNTGDKYLVTETFKLNAASGSHWVFDGDFILCNKDGATGIDADWEIELGIMSRPVQADFSAKNLFIDVTGNSATSITADYINLLNDANEVYQISAVDDSYDIDTDLMSGTSEKASTWYQLWIDEDKKLLMVPDIAGTDDGAHATASALQLSTATFLTDGVKAGDIVYNTSSGTQTTVASDPVLETELILTDDIMLVTNTFVIHMLSPTGMGDFKSNIGAVYNDAGSDLDVTKQKDKYVHVVARPIILSAGDQAAYTLINLLAFIPINAKKIDIMYDLYDVGDQVSSGISADGTNDGVVIQLLADDSSNAEIGGSISMVLSVMQKIYYKVVAGDQLGLYLTGYEL